jgi:hypothetical protein
MRRVRAMHDLTVTEFCRRYKFSITQWVNYEAGFMPSLNAAKQLKRQIHGLTLDWIYEGDTSGLPLMLERKLTELRNE